MKVLVISDTHGYEGDVLRILYREKNIDLLIHCGDVEGGERKIREMCGCPCWFVKGNNDYFSDLPQHAVFKVGKYTIFVAHGHQYGVSVTKGRLEAEARKWGADIAMFGHTHYPYLEEKGDIILLNPGSLTYPRQEGRQGSYLLMELDGEGEAHFQQRFLES